LPARLPAAKKQQSRFWLSGGEIALAKAAIVCAAPDRA
jgi:hypothetical protein